MMFNLERITREHIKHLKAYSSARDEFSGEAKIWLDANENPFGNNWNRYPDPLQTELKHKIAELKSVPVESIFLGNGSDEAIDLLFRAFCKPGHDRVLQFPPTYGMYKVCADIHDVSMLEIPLNETFQPDLEKVISVIDNDQPPLIFICSPNNPTGNLIQSKYIREIAGYSPGLVVVDEAYIDFAEGVTCLKMLNDLPNLVVLQTFSKAWGLAGLRLGMAFASPEIIAVLNRIKMPYNLSAATQREVLKALLQKQQVEEHVQRWLSEREALTGKLQLLPFIQKVYRSDANFLLVQCSQPKEIYNYLLERGIVVRDRTNQVANCLRITVGTKEENQVLMDALKGFDDEK